MGHTWPLTTTCGQTVPTFRVTWVLLPSRGSTSWKGTEKWSINQPPLSPACSPNIPEVQALVTLSPHLDQQILATEAHDIKGTPSSVWEPWSPEPMLPISSHWSWKDGLKVELGAGL